MTAAVAGLSRRAIAILRDAEPLICPDGHAIPRDAWIPGCGAVRCKHRHANQHQSQCGKIVMVISLASGVRAVAEVNHTEAAYIEAHRLDAAAIQQYLGLGWTITDRRR